MSGLQNRVRKLEDATGINEPCEVCEAAKRFEAKLEDFHKSIRFKRAKPKPDELVTRACYWCLRPRVESWAGYSENLRALFERLSVAWEQGTLCAPENANLFEELKIACEVHERGLYGEHYDAVKALIDEYIDEMPKIAARTNPRKIYFCRGLDCHCNYPKTEEEWRARMKRRLAA
jgi:hypothetical protein